MDDFQIFGLQFVLSVVVYTLIAKWYVAPRLARLPLHDALIPAAVAPCDPTHRDGVLGLGSRRPYASQCVRRAEPQELVR